MNEISNFYLLCFVNLFVKILEHNTMSDRFRDLMIFCFDLSLKNVEYSIVS